MKTWKLLSGLFTLMSSFFVGLSGVVLGLDQAFKQESDKGESDGIFLAFFMFFGGLVSIFLRKSKVGGNIAIIILHAIIAIIGFQSDATKWHVVGAWGLLCAIIAAYSLYQHYKSDNQTKEADTNKQILNVVSNRQCPYCHADVPSGSAFCGSCGKELPKEKVCPQCGASIDANAQFCSNCGMNLSTDSIEETVSSQSEYVYEEGESPIRKYLPFIIGAIALVAICGGGWWYSNSSKAPQVNNEAEVADSISTDSVAAEAVEEEFAADTLASDIPPMEQSLNAYEPILDKYIAKGESNNHYEEYYFLHDVTGDGIPELWLHVDGGESYNLLTFTYKDGQTKQISKIDVGHPSHHSFYSGSNYILIVYASMGASSWHKCEYNNGKIQDKEIFSETLSEEDENAEYKEPSETAISPIEITNKQELHNIVY